MEAVNNIQGGNNIFFDRNLQGGNISDFSMETLQDLAKQVDKINMSVQENNIEDEENNKENNEVKDKKKVVNIVIVKRKEKMKRKRVGYQRIQF